MLDKRTELMLRVASTLTAEDLDYLRNQAPAVATISRAPCAEAETAEKHQPLPSPEHAQEQRLPEDSSRGERERMRTRESKISTACVGKPRGKHEWWPVGTELIGQMRDQTFTAQVVENPRVKSNRSLLITSSPARGTVCITPTRAAIEATEAYRQANSLGRGGGVTNGWTFWKPKEAMA